MNGFRLLRADEIDCRISTIKKNGISLLLYKDARCDQNILDETVGPMNWKNSYSRDNANCTISIWDKEKNEWISKENTGTESYTEKEKGLASDSFKRAAFNWGIGRELYTAPFIWIGAEHCKIQESGGKITCYDRFKVTDIGYDENNRINRLSIADSNGKEVFCLGKKSGRGRNEAPAEAEPKQTTLQDLMIAELFALLADNQIAPQYVYEMYKVTGPKELSKNAHENIRANIKAIKRMYDQSMRVAK